MTQLPSPHRRHFWSYNGRFEPAAGADRYISPYADAIVHLGLDDPGPALALQEPAANERFPWTIRYNVDSLLEALRPDPAVQGAVAADWNSRRAPLAS
jgi:hypothetical protein